MLRGERVEEKEFERKREVKCLYSIENVNSFLS